MAGAGGGDAFVAIFDNAVVASDACTYSSTAQEVIVGLYPVFDGILFAADSTDPIDLGTGQLTSAGNMDIAIGKFAPLPGAERVRQTPQSDVAEIRALEQVFGDRLATISMSATKSMIGHLLGGAGGVETIAVVCTLRDQKIHPSINVDRLDPDFHINVVTSAATITA